MNPLKEARDRAEAAVRALLEEVSVDTDFETRLLDLVEATVRYGTQGFHRRDPRTASDPALDPTWIPTAKTELADRLAEMNLVHWEAAEIQWRWSDGWLAGVLARRALRRGDPAAAREREAAWLRNVDTPSACIALALEVEPALHPLQREMVELYLESPIGREALAVAIALLAPADDEGGEQSGLAAFTELLDRVFGAPLAFRPPRHRRRIARILDLSRLRLEGIPTLQDAWNHLAGRLSEQLSGAAAAEPRDPALQIALARSHLTIAKANRPAPEALERCRHALDAVRRAAHLDTAETRTGQVLHEVSERIIELPREGGDPTDFLRTYSLAIDALTASAIPGLDTERSLRQQVQLLGWTVELQWESAPADALAAFRSACRRIDDLIALRPLDPRYVEARRFFAEEFAKLAEANDPELAAAVRAESRAYSPPEPPSSGVPEPAATPQLSPTAELSADPVGSGRQTDREPTDLIDRMRSLLRRSPAEAEWAVAESNEVLREICQRVILREMGLVPGWPSLDQMTTWLTKSGRLPRRLRYDLIILDLYRTPFRSRPGPRVATLPDPSGISVRALVRVARWFLEEYLGVEIPPDLRLDFDERRPGESPGGTDAGPPPAGPATGLQRPLRNSAGWRRASRAEPPSLPDASASAPGRAATLSTAQIEEAARLGVPPRHVEARTGMVLVLIPSGAVTLVPDPAPEARAAPGLSSEAVEVRVPAFYCGIAPVLQREWSKVLSRNPSLFEGPDLPVSIVTLEQIQAFLAELNRSTDGVRFRLPLEPEWELAARAGSFTRFWWGDDFREGWANCAGAGVGSGLQRPTAPGRYPASPYGLLDIHGNVQEWCARHLVTARSALGRPISHPRLAEGDGHVLKGGGWRSLTEELRIAYGCPAREGVSQETAGFRCVCDVPEARGEVLRWRKAP